MGQVERAQRAGETGAIRPLGANVPDAEPADFRKRIAPARWPDHKTAAFTAWTYTDGQPERELTRDEMLDEITAYWRTNTGSSSARLYWQSHANDYNDVQAAFRPLRRSGGHHVRTTS